MSNEHILHFPANPTMQFGEFVVRLVEHMKKSDTDNAEFEFDGYDCGIPVKICFEVTLKKVQ